MHLWHCENADTCLGSSACNLGWRCDLKRVAECCADDFFLFEQSKKHRRCPDCNAPAQIGDVLRLFANLGSKVNGVNNNNDNDSNNKDVNESDGARVDDAVVKRNEHLEALTVSLETRLHAAMKDKYDTKHLFF
jgi:hypothetical protein